MSERDQDDLSKWIEGKLDDESLASSYSKEDINKFKAILNKVDSFEPAQDLQIDIDSIVSGGKKSGSVFMGGNLRLAIAASITVLLISAAYLFFYHTTKVSTSFGETMVFTLPDGTTEVTLGPNSSLSYNNRRFPRKRRVRLDGQAFFDVNEKGDFKVEFEDGEVNVLGTEFEVLEYESGLKVACYEGKVSMSYESQTQEIEAGELIRFIDGVTDSRLIDTQSPAWIKGTSSFEDAPLKEVINVLKSVFEVEVITNDIDLERRFTGKFNHENLELACKVVFSSLSVDYTLEGKTITLSSK
ncbi:MAG: FecR domain-containing protein [Bacteroidota bacterium]